MSAELITICFAVEIIKNFALGICEPQNACFLCDFASVSKALQFALNVRMAMRGRSSAAPLVKNSGLLFNKLYNVFGKEVAPPSSSDDAFATAWGNQAKPNGRFVDFVEGKQPSEADFMFNSFCGSWYEPANKWGEERGFVDNIWLLPCKPTGSAFLLKVIKLGKQPIYRPFTNVDSFFRSLFRFAAHHC